MKKNQQIAKKKPTSIYWIKSAHLLPINNVYAVDRDIQLTAWIAKR